MTMSMNVGGPVRSVDNGDGTYTFEFGDGRQPMTAAGPIAKQKHDQFTPLQVNPDIVESAKKPEDERIAYGYGIGGAGGVGKPPGSLDDAAAQGAAGNASVADVGGGGAGGRQGTSVPYSESPAGAGGAGQPGASVGGARENMAGVNPQAVDPSTLTFGNQGGMGGFGGAPRMFVPGAKGGWQDVSRESKEGFKASDELKGQRKYAQNLEEESADRQYVAQQGATQFAIEATAKKADAVAKNLAEDDARMSRQQQQVEAKHAELQRLSDDLATQKIDPRALFKENDGLTGIGMAFAAAAGAFGSGLTGAPNTALETVNKLVDRNIAAQQENLANKKDVIGAKRQEFQALKDSFATDNERQAAHRVLAWDAVQAQLDAQKAHLGPAMDEAAYTQMSAGIAEKRAQAMERFEKEAQNTTVLHSRYQPARAGGFVQGAPAKFEHDRYVPQFGGLAPDAARATKAQEAGLAHANTESLVKANVALRNDPKAYVPGTDANARLKSNQADLTIAVKEQAKLGALSGADLDLVQGVLGEGTSIKPGQTAALQNYLANSGRRNAQMRQHLGIVPVQVVPYMDPKTGQIHMGQQFTGGPSSPTAAPELTERGR